MHYNFITVITDCFDPNVTSRQVTRYASLFGITPTLIRVDNYKSIQAAGILLDTLDAITGDPGVICVNVAPRHGRAKKWPNGTPFGYFFYQDNLVVTTIDTTTLALVKKFALVDEVYVMDIETVLRSDAINHMLDETTKQRIIKTQFRSFEFVPRVAKWLADGFNIPAKAYPIAEIEDLPPCIWFEDNFGNCKTNILPGEIGFEVDKTIQTNLGEFQCFERLKDVPDGQKAMIVGSSGLGERRFVEIVVQGKPADQTLGIKVGDEVRLA